MGPKEIVAIRLLHFRMPWWPEFSKTSPELPITPFARACRRQVYSLAPTSGPLCGFWSADLPPVVQFKSKT